MTSDLTFLIVSDTHVHIDSGKPDWDCSWNKILNTKGDEILSVFVEDANAIGPDFVVHCGDLTNVSDEASCRTACEILSDLKCPLYFVPGNHDTYLPDCRRVAGELLGLDGLNLPRVVNVGNWRLILIDAVYWRNKDGSVHKDFDPDQHDDIIAADCELEAVRAELDRDSTAPTICFSHPILKVRSEGYPVSCDTTGKPIKGGLLKWNENEGNPSRVTAVLDNYPCVKAVFYGHGHWHDCLLANGGNGRSDTLYCQTAALSEFPCEYRKITLASDRIDVETMKLSRGGFAELSYIPARGNRWPAGRPIDRSFSHKF